ncbi:MAG: hypothetical protein HGA70_03900 [Chlorobiaceae bacterium]|nr:hypothetical protein [Chlorobiaceae bacterium]
MKAMILEKVVSLHDCAEPLKSVDYPVLFREADDQLLKVQVCGYALRSLTFQRHLWMEKEIRSRKN